LIRLNGKRALCILVSLVLVASAPAAAEIVLFAAGPDQISSLGVLGIAEDLHGDLYFGTDNGLSIYDGTWRISHRTFGEPSTGLLNDHILAVAFDSEGRLWLGYPDGLQRLEGNGFVTIQDQQLLKSLDIHDLLLANGRMWVAAGNSGVHRYLDGGWTWFSPQGSEGLGCNYVQSMASDSTGDTLYVACNEGIYVTKNTDEPVAFIPVPGGSFTAGEGMTVQSDPFGGIYIFNKSVLFHYTQPDQWDLILSSSDLTPGIDITDVRADSDGTLWVATNNGIYAWKDGQVGTRLGVATGIRSNGVKKIYIDSQNRLWFVTTENVGYYRIPQAMAAGGSVIPITTFSVQTTIPTPAPQGTQAPVITPAISYGVVQVTPSATPSNPLSDLLNAISGFFNGLFHR